MGYSRGFKFLELSYEKTDGNPENLYYVNIKVKKRNVPQIKGSNH